MINLIKPMLQIQLFKLSIIQNYKQNYLKFSKKNESTNNYAKMM